MKFRDYSNYEIYDDGRIWSYKRKKWLKPSIHKNGYQVVCLCDNEGKGKSYYLHRVIYETFSGEPIPPSMQVNHIDEDKTSNFFANLNLMTPKQNINYGTGIKRKTKSQSKQVGAFKDGKLVLSFPSTQEAERNGFYSSAVSACCRNCYMREGNNKYKGFYWRFL